MDCLSNLGKCGAACCKQLSFFVGPLTDDQIHYYKLHDCKVLRQKNRRGWKITVPVRCTALTEDLKCSLQGTPEKPQVCKDFGDKTIKGYTIPENCIYGNAKV